MTERLFSPDLVGRDAELKALTDGLESAFAGKGCAILVSGEAGIGKSRLCEEALALAASKGAAVAKGWCVEGALEPLHPFREALRAIGLSYAFDDSPPPELLALYLLDQGGVLVAQASKASGGVDADIFSGMLQAISNFAKDSLTPLGAAQSGLGSISYGDMRITIRSHGGFSLASITRGRENEALVAEMDAVLAENAPALSAWNGNLAYAGRSKEALEAMVSSGRYEGRHLVDDPSLRRNGLLEGVMAALSRKSAETPVALYLDDLQWADPTTVSLLHYVARNAPRGRLMLLGTFRPEDVSAEGGVVHPLSTAIKTMSREGVVKVVRLERLGADSSRELAEAALGGSVLEQGLHERMQREGGGNPFYTLELLKLMAETGSLVVEVDGRWRLARAVEQLDVPERVADIVTRRLDRMKSEDARLLSAAAVLGEEFGLDRLADLMGTPRLELVGRLDNIESGTGLVRSAANGYRFDHSKVREAAYARLGVGMRRELHRLAAESLMKSADARMTSDVALHLHEAGDSRARGALAAAARRARERFAVEEAARLYKMAAEHSALGREEALELADCERHLGAYDDAMAAYSSMMDGTTGAERGAILTMMADVRDLQSSWDESARLGAEAYRILEPLGPSRELTKCCHVMYHVSMRRGAMKDAEAWALRQVELARGLGDRQARALAEHDLGTLYLQVRRFDDALPHIEAAAEQRRACGDLVGLGASLNNLGAIHHNRGAFETAAEYYQESLAIKRAVGDARGIASTAANLSYTLKSSGDLRSALRFMEESLGIRRRIGDLSGQCTCLNGIGYLLFEMMEYDRAERNLTEGIESAERIGDLPNIGMALANVGEVMLCQGRLDDAIGALERGIAIGREVGDGLMQSLCRVALAEASVSKGELGAADGLLAKVKSDAEEMRADNLLADYHRAMGILCAAKGDDDRARANFLASIETRARLGDGFPLARSRRAYAAYLRSRGDAAAEAVAKEVIDYGRRVGLEKLVDAIKTEHPGLA